MNERIKLLFEQSGKSKAAIAQALDVTPSYITKLTNKADATPSSRLISAICREFRVEERWLRTGEGEMFVQSTRAQLLADFMADVMTDTEDSARLALVSLLADLDVEDWEAINKIFKKHFQK